MKGIFEGWVKETPIKKILEEDTISALVEDDNVVGFQLHKYLALHKDKRIRITIEELWAKPRDVPLLEDLPEREFSHALTDGYQELFKEATELRQTLENLTNKTFGLISDLTSINHDQILREARKKFGDNIEKVRYRFY